MAIPEEELKAAFDFFDADGSGAITADELKQVCEKLGIPPEGESFEAMIAEADADGDGKVKFDEFVKFAGAQ